MGYDGRVGWRRKNNGKVYYVASNGGFAWLEGDHVAAVEAEADLLRVFEQLKLEVGGGKTGRKGTR
jgi:predicted heme/steroid binding protein